MYQSIDSFIQEWTYETTSTERILRALTDDSLTHEFGSDVRTLGRLAWHIVGSHHEMLTRTGLIFEPVGDEHMIPASAQAIADAYKRSSDALVAALKSQWTDADLEKMVDMYGEQWPNGVTLNVLVKHEIHHRGQMTPLMRIAGLRVPDVYGPTLEDWSKFQMEPPAV